MTPPPLRHSLLTVEILREIESRLGLHKHIHIFYCVDSIQITLVDDNDRELDKCVGFTLEDALYKFAMAVPK